MRLAFVDLMFSWPPHGGADVDLYHTALNLRRLGHEVRLFAAADASVWERGRFDPDALPFDAERLDFQRGAFTKRAVTERFREAVDAWRPDIVLLTDQFFLKPYMARALAHYPLVSRCYAYEVACPRDLLLFKDGAVCPNSYLVTPDVCRRCALARMAPEIRAGRMLAWSQEWLAARAYLPGYHAALCASLRQYSAIIVYNELQRAQLAPFNGRIAVFPGGVNVESYAAAPEPERNPPVIAMAGRAEDPAKGFDVLLEAGRQLAAEGITFEVRATAPPRADCPPWLRPTGWLSPEGIRGLYQDAAVCVVPSRWAEPFGLVAVEAMASGRPVCASRIGGLKDIVDDGETGRLFDPGDAAGLARALKTLLGDAALRRRMGRAARERAEQVYDWRRVVETHYPPLLEEALHEHA